MKKQGGFTIIELVLVIVILGILAAYAVPKFIGMDREARMAVMKGFNGALQSGVAMVHGRALVEGKAYSSSSSITTDDSTVINMKYGYPTAADVKKVLQDVDSSNFTDATTTNTTTFNLVGAANASKCYVKYTEATGSSDAAKIAMDTSGCFTAANNA